MSHLRASVLPEPNFRGLNPDIFQEMHCHSQEPSNSWVLHNSRFECFFDCNFNLTWVRAIGIGQHVDPSLPSAQIDSRRLFRIDEILQFGHIELPEPNHPLPRTNFVPVSLTSLHCSEWQPLPKMPVECWVEHEHPLRSLRPHESGPRTPHCTYARLEHQTHRTST